MSARARRIGALILKEAREIIRTPLPMTIAFAGPVILLLLFAFGLSLDIERVPVGIVIERSTPDARDLAGAFSNVRYFHAVHFVDRRAAEEAVIEGRIAGVVVLAGDFTRAVLAEGGAPVQVLVDGVDGRTGRMLASYVDSAVANWLLQRALVRRSDSPPTIQMEARIWFNPEIKSRLFLAPGLVALLMTVTGALLAGLIVAREWERGMMEALLATPARAFDLLAAKIVAYLTLALCGMAATLWLATSVMDVPFRGSFLVLAVAAALFMLCALSLGFIISAATRNRGERRTSHAHARLPADGRALGPALRPAQRAGGDPVAEPCRRRPVFRVDPAHDLPRRRRLARPPSGPRRDGGDRGRSCSPASSGLSRKRLA